MDDLLKCSKEISGTDGAYRVTDTGVVLSCLKVAPIFIDGIRGCIGTKSAKSNVWKVLSLTSVNKRCGHLRVKIFGEVRLVHQLVLETFVGECPEGLQCCHKDGNPKNNSLENLRWDTQQANYADSVRHGTNARGNKIHTCKLTEAEVLEIRSAYAKDPKYGAQTALGRKYGVSCNTIRSIVILGGWKHVT